MASIRFTADDRDETGKIAAPPRSLSDLLPPPADADPTNDERRTTNGGSPIPRELLLFASACVLIAIGLMIVFVSRAPTAPAASPAAATSAPAPTAGAAPTAAPTPLPALLAYFDYRDGSSSTPLSAGQIARVIARAGDDWRQVSLNNSAARPWLRASDVPAGVPSADELPDLAPRPTLAPVLVPIEETGRQGDREAGVTATPASPSASAVPTFDSVAFQKGLDATHVALMDFALAHGFPGGVIPATPTP